MASGKTQGTGCALVSNLKVPEVLLSFHQANMGWPASSWISAPGVAKRRGSGGNLGNSPWTARHIWSSRLAWRGPCFHGRVTAAHPVVGFNSALLTLFLAQARPGFAFPCVVRVASHARCNVGCQRRCRPALALAAPGPISIWGALWRCSVPDLGLHVEDAVSSRRRRRRRRAGPAWNVLDSACQAAGLWKPFCLDYYLSSLQVLLCASS